MDVELLSGDAMLETVRGLFAVPEPGTPPELGVMAFVGAGARDGLLAFRSIFTCPALPVSDMAVMIRLAPRISPPSLKLFWCDPGAAFSWNAWKWQRIKRALSPGVKVWLVIVLESMSECPVPRGELVLALFGDAWHDREEDRLVSQMLWREPEPLNRLERMTEDRVAGKTPEYWFEAVSGSKVGPLLRRKVLEPPTESHQEGYWSLHRWDELETQEVRDAAALERFGVKPDSCPRCGGENFQFSPCRCRPDVPNKWRCDGCGLRLGHKDDRWELIE